MGKGGKGLGRQDRLTVLRARQHEELPPYEACQVFTWIARDHCDPLLPPIRI